jgi:hypothetical protein
VSYEGGSSAVTVNQRVNGGPRNLLGTYGFAPGAGEEKKVEGEEKPEED